MRVVQSAQAAQQMNALHVQVPKPSLVHLAMIRAKLDSIGIILVPADESCAELQMLFMYKYQE